MGWDVALPLGAGSMATVASPTGTTSLTGVMMGLAGAFTPSTTGRLFLMISGTCSNTTATDGVSFQIRYGTGTAPANAASLTGTATGSAGSATIAATNNKEQFNLQALITGLVIGTAYWYDLSLAAVTGGTASVTAVTLTALEF